MVLFRILEGDGVGWLEDSRNNINQHGSSCVSGLDLEDITRVL